MANAIPIETERRSSFRPPALRTSTAGILVRHSVGEAPLAWAYLRTKGVFETVH